MNKLLRNKVTILIFITPALILFTCVMFIPICQAIFYSFTEYNLVGEMKWVGLRNFRALLKDDVFKIAFKNSIFFLLFSCVSQLIMGVLLAGLLTNIPKGRNFFKNVIYLPCVLSSAALGLMWMLMFSPKLGISQVLKAIGIKPPLFLGDANGFIILPMWIIAFVALWQYVGQSMMLYIAQISGIDKELYEASYIDGCNRSKSFRYITLPLIRPMVGTAMSLNAIGSLKFFDLIWTMTETKPAHKTEVLATHLYTQGFKFSKYGYASAIGVVLLVMCLIATLVINRLFRVENYVER